MSWYCLEMQITYFTRERYYLIDYRLFKIAKIYNLFILIYQFLLYSDSFLLFSCKMNYIRKKDILIIVSLIEKYVLILYKLFRITKQGAILINSYQIKCYTNF